MYNVPVDINFTQPVNLHDWTQISQGYKGLVSASKLHLTWTQSGTGTNNRDKTVLVTLFNNTCKPKTT